MGIGLGLGIFLVVWGAFMLAESVSPCCRAPTQAEETMEDLAFALPWAYGLGVPLVATLRGRHGVSLGFAIGIVLAALIFGICAAIVISSLE